MSHFCKVGSLVIVDECSYNTYKYIIYFYIKELVSLELDACILCIYVFGIVGLQMLLR